MHWPHHLNSRRPAADEVVEREAQTRGRRAALPEVDLVPGQRPDAQHAPPRLQPRGDVRSAHHRRLHRTRDEPARTKSHGQLQGRLRRLRPQRSPRHTHTVVENMDRHLGQQLHLVGYPASGVGQAEISDFEAATTLGHGLPSGVGEALGFRHLFTGPLGRRDGLAPALRVIDSECD